LRVAKRTFESGSSKRKKATANADALRAVIGKMKPITQFFTVPEGSTAKMATDPEYSGKILRFYFGPGPGAGLKNL